LKQDITIGQFNITYIKTFSINKQLKQDRKSNGLPNWYQDLETADARTRSHGSFKFKWLKTSMDMSRPRHCMKSCLFFPSDIYPRMKSLISNKVVYQLLANDVMRKHLYTKFDP